MSREIIIFPYGEVLYTKSHKLFSMILLLGLVEFLVEVGFVIGEAVLLDELFDALGVHVAGLTGGGGGGEGEFFAGDDVVDEGVC